METFFNSEEYKKAKLYYEQQCFKLFGRYCKYDGEKLIEKSANEMSEYFKNKKLSIEYIEQQTTKKGTTVSTTKEITKSFYQIWSEDPNMREYEDIVFNCNLANVKPHQFNLFDGFRQFDKMPQKTVDLSTIFDHIKSLVDYNEEHFKYVLNYFAQLVQQPHILPHTSLIFISEEGVGKDIFATFIGQVLGDKYTHNTEKLEQICGKFNTVLGGKLLMVVNETNPVESRERIENLKFLITAEKIAIEGKHKDPVKSDNYCRFVFFSNRLFAFPVEGEGSRRPVIFKSSSKYLVQTIGKEANKKYFDKLVDMYKDKDYQNTFLKYLQKLDITNFNPKNFEKSELHKELEDSSVSPMVSYLANLVEIAGQGKPTIRYSTTESLKDYNDYLKQNNYKYDYTQAKYNVELVSNFKIEKIKSGGNMYFVFDMKKLKELLETKYKYNFDEVDILPKPLSPLDGEPDYKRLFLEQQEEIIKLKLELQKLKAVEKPKSNKSKHQKEIKQPKTTDEDDELRKLEEELEKLI